MKAFYNILLALVIIGAINWGMVGLFSIDLVGLIFGGSTSILSKIIFTLVGIAGICSIALFPRVNED